MAFGSAQRGHTLHEVLQTAHTSTNQGQLSLRADTQVLTGEFSHRRFKTGVNIHSADMVEEQDLDIQFNAEARLTLGILLEGDLEFSVEGKNYHLRANRELGYQAFALTTTERQVVCRHVRRGRQVRKLNISVTKHWLEQEGRHSPTIARVLAGFFKASHDCVIWQPSQRILNLAESIIQPSQATQALQSLQQEYLAIELLNNALQDISQKTPKTQQHRIALAISLINSSADKDLSLADIAQHAGMSISSLQRHFRAQHKKTVVQYVREQKLKAAQEALLDGSLSIGEAAYFAGYQHVSNFISAYKKTFGITPGGERSSFQLGERDR